MDKTVVTTDIFVEFLEVAIHLILYTRQIYPPIIFEKRKKYNTPVQMSIHPELNKYIQNVVEAVRILLKQHFMEKLAIAIFNNRNEPVEKFIFEVKPAQFADSEIEDGYLLRLEQAIRAFCLKISTCEALLAPLPPGCFFGVQVHTQESSSFSLDMEPITQKFPWIEAEPEQVTMDNSQIIPLKSLDHELLTMQLYVEEKKNKS